MSSAHFRPDAKVSFRLADTFTRNVRPFVDGLPNLRYARDNNTVDAELRFRSESDVLRAFIGYQLGWDFFEDRGPGEFGYAGSLTHAIRTGVYWEFLPQTGFVYEGQVERVSFDEEGGRVAGVRRLAHSSGGRSQRSDHASRVRDRHAGLLLGVLRQRFRLWRRPRCGHGALRGSLSAS
jgi:hypothetical protein